MIDTQIIFAKIHYFIKIIVYFCFLFSIKEYDKNKSTAQALTETHWGRFYLCLFMRGFRRVLQFHNQKQCKGKTL